MRGNRTIVVVLAVCCLAAMPALGQVVGAEFLTLSGASVINLDGSVPASALEVGMVWLAPAYSREGGALNSLQCLATARNRGELQRGMSLSLEGEIFGEDGETLRTLSRKTRPFNPAARFSWDFPDYSAEMDAVGFMLAGGLIGEVPLDFAKVQCRAINRLRCENTRYTLCAVGNNRFKVQLDLGGDQCPVESRRPRWGWFSMPGSSRQDVYVELLDRCQMNDHFWVAVGSLTGRSYKVVVEDTLSGETRSFDNPGKNMIMVDSSAFPTCP